MDKQSEDSLDSSDRYADVSGFFSDSEDDQVENVPDTSYSEDETTHPDVLVSQEDNSTQSNVSDDINGQELNEAESRLSKARADKDSYGSDATLPYTPSGSFDGDDAMDSEDQLEVDENEQEEDEMYDDRAYQELMEDYNKSNFLLDKAIKKHSQELDDIYQTRAKKLHRSLLEVKSSISSITERIIELEMKKKAEEQLVLQQRLQKIRNPEQFKQTENKQVDNKKHQHEKESSHLTAKPDWTTFRKLCPDDENDQTMPFPIINNLFEDSGLGRNSFFGSDDENQDSETEYQVSSYLFVFNY